MDAFSILAIIIGIIGLLGSFLPVIPGPPLGWVGLLLVYFSQTANDPVSVSVLAVTGVFAIMVTVLDYILPSTFTKIAGGHKSGSTGAFVGMILGIFLTPIGMVMGSFLGALAAEFLIERQPLTSALKAAAGTFVSFILTTGLKAIYCVAMLWVTIAAIF